jgi:hypothetical protein
MAKVGATPGHRTTDADLEVIRKMAGRYGDADIARVLNKLGRRTGKGKPWSDVAVRTARRNHAIDGRRETLAEPALLTLQGAARYTATSDTTIKKLVDAGVLPMRQLVPFAPWEIRRADLGAEPVRAILKHLKRNGRLLIGDQSGRQRELFQGNRGDDDARYRTHPISSSPDPKRCTTVTVPLRPSAMPARRARRRYQPSTVRTKTPRTARHSG